jgi:ABC-type oligopeptide transport system substrate-binding subunit
MRRSRGTPAALAPLAAMMTLLPVALSGCGLLLPVAQPTATPIPPLPDRQQILRPLDIGPARGDLETLDPALIEFTLDQNLGQLLFPPLVTLDEQSQPVDWAAQSHEISSDGLTYTFHLRTGMMWSDGTPIDAQTFAYSINRALDPCTQAPNANYLYSIKGAQTFNTGMCPAGATKSATSLIGSALLAPDPLTLNIILSQPAGYFLTVLTNPIAWGVPQALVERYTMPSTDPHNPVVRSTWTEHLADNGGFGGNLYKLVTWKHRGGSDPAQVALERNERFWGVKPHLRRIESTLYGSVEAAWIFFKQGTGDIAEPATSASDYNSQDYARKYAQEVATARTLKGVQVMESPQLLVTWLAPNWHIAPFDDVRIRQALSLVIDRTRLAHEVSADMVLPSIHLVPEGMPDYNAALADAAHRTGEHALVPDLVTARALGTAYAADKCAGDFATCAPIVLHSSSAAPLNALRAQMIQENWREVFPQWRFESYSSTCHLVHCTGETLQLDTRGWFADYPDPQDFLSLQWSTQSIYNQSFVSIPQVDALCAQADAMQDHASRVPLYQQAEQLLITQGAAIPLYQNKATYVVRSHVVGWRVAPIGMTPLSVWQQVYIKR